MSTTIVDDLQRATTAINKIQRAIERKTSESLDNVPVEEYDDIIKNDMPSLEVNEYTQQTITFENSITLDDNTTAADIADKINYSSMLSNALFNNDSTDPDSSAKELIIQLNITDSRSTQGPVTGTEVKFSKAFKNLQGRGLTLKLNNIASYGSGVSGAKFENASFTAAFEEVNKNLPLDDCDGKIKIYSGTSQGVDEQPIATYNLNSVLCDAKGIYTEISGTSPELDINKIFTLVAKNGYAQVGHMLDGFTAPDTDVIAPSFLSIDFSTDTVGGDVEYANINVKSLTNVYLGYKNPPMEQYNELYGRSTHAFYNSTMQELIIKSVPGIVYYRNNPVTVSEIQSFLDLADVWDAVDFTELATAYSALLQLGTDYQEGSTFSQGNAVVYKYADQQLSGDESAITALGVTIVDIPRAEA